MIKYTKYIILDSYCLLIKENHLKLISLSDKL